MQISCSVVKLNLYTQIRMPLWRVRQCKSINDQNRLKK